MLPMLWTQKREEIRRLKQEHAQIAATQSQKLTELQSSLDEAQSHKLIFEIDRELHRNKVELEISVMMTTIMLIGSKPD